MPNSQDFISRLKEILKNYEERFHEGRYEAAAQAAEMMTAEARLLRNVAKLYAEQPQEAKACSIDNPECEACQ